MLFRSWSRRSISGFAYTITAILLITSVTAPFGKASAFTLKTLHSFCSWLNCKDGADPGYAGGIRDQSGIFYGTTSRGGKHDGGAVFELVPNAGQTKWTEHVLYSFCSRSCADGQEPYNDLILDTDGSLYGTTFAGGKYANGSIFKLTHRASSWKLTTLYSFCPQSGCVDGSNPQSRLTYAGQASGAPWDKSSPLFATTVGGGQYNDGAAVQLVQNGATWNETVIHNFHNTFDSQASRPLTQIMDTAGNLFGTTELGGKYGGGLMYELEHGTWNEKILHNFCNTENCADGKTPYGTLLMDAAGNLFGTTEYGGILSCDFGNDVGCGVAFEYTSGGTYKVIYNFCSRTDCNDGANPFAGLVMDSHGYLFGTTRSGGLGQGVAFVLLGSGGSWAESVLYPFCSLPNCTDGGLPQAPLSIDAAGNLWGMTFGIGEANRGTAFELKP